MKNIYLAAYHRFLVSFKQINHFPKLDSRLYYRFPKTDFKQVITRPCITQHPQSQPQLIQAYKSMRSATKVSESKTCLKCQHNKICPWAKKVPTEQDVAASNPLENMSLMLQSASTQQQLEYDTWVSLYRVASFMRIICEDLGHKNNQTMLFMDDKSRHQDELKSIFKYTQHSKNQLQPNKRSPKPSPAKAKTPTIKKMVKLGAQPVFDIVKQSITDPSIDSKSKPRNKLLK